MKKIIVAALLALTLSILMAQQGDRQKAYISKYSGIAVSEMYRSGVPASITLAQGLLESGAGFSRLTTEGKNHFGIKCHDWKGRKIYHDDDAKGECFRAYDSDEESFRDHSDFLRYKDRYKFLFDYDIKDYKAWAYGLKKAGYATDPAYAAKLIKVVEDYDLSRFDRMSAAEGEKLLEAEEEKQLLPEGRKTKEKAARHKKERRRKKKVETVIPDVIPQSPNSIEEPRAYSPKYAETFNFSLNRQLYSKNDVPFVYSVEGETYATIAEANNLFVREILKFNDLKMDTKLLPGTIVYLQPKKKQAQKGLDKYIVEMDGESLWKISQRFGIRLRDLLRMNNFTEDHSPREGDTILLRPVDMVKREKNVIYD